MSLLEETRERVPAPARQPIRVVDSDCHPSPRAGELAQYIPEPYRKRFASMKKGEAIFYDAPDYAHARAMRVDSFPDDGNFAGSDPELFLKHAVVQGGSDVCILEPGMGGQPIPELASAMCTAINHWQDNHWLDSHNNWHERYYGSVCVAVDEPLGAAREIDTWAAHPWMKQVLLRAEPRPAWGDPKYDPVWEAATRNNIPVACHVSRGREDTMPLPPVGFPAYNHDFMVTYSLLTLNQVTSLIFDGTFDRFPTLKIILVEHGFNWILPLMWRMDAMYDARKSWLDIKRKPSEYVKEHIKFTTQPLDYPEDKTELTRAFELMEADKILLFSSDYPHWTYDDPHWLVKHLPKHMREAIMFKNGIELYGLPDTVPALDGKSQVF